MTEREFKKTHRGDTLALRRFRTARKMGKCVIGLRRFANICVWQCVHPDGLIQIGGLKVLLSGCRKETLNADEG